MEWLAPPDAIPFAADELHLWRVELDVDPGVRQHLAALLSPDESERAARFVFAQDRDRFIVARGFLRRLLGRYLRLAARQLAFSYSPHGKPFLPSPADGPTLHFNLAHSGTVALYALAWERRVGIDVERIRADLPYRTLASSIFSPREIATLATLPEAEGRRAFFTGWARKEATIKARGDGLAYPPERVEVSLLPNEPARVQLPPEENELWALYALDAGPDYAAAVAVEGAAALRCCCFTGDVWLTEGSLDPP